MTKVIAVATDKGGDGKTTVSINQSENFAHEKHKKGLLIDFDPQGNTSKRYVEMQHDPFANDAQGKKPCPHPDYNPNSPDHQDWDGVSSVADIFTGKQVHIYPTRIKNLDILPAHASPLEEIESVSKKEVAKLVYDRFVDFIKSDEIQQKYDFVIIDTRPSKGVLTTAAIKAASHLIIPSTMEPFSIQGLYGMLQLWLSEKYERTSDNPLKLTAILPNRIENVNLHRDYLEELRSQKEVGKYLCPYVLKKRVVYAELMAEGAQPQSIFELPDGHPAKTESTQVCDYLYERIFS